MGSLAWRVLSTGSAMLAAAVAHKVVTKGWEVATGRPTPGDPTNPEESSWTEAIFFAAATGLVMQLARVIATRKAAEYYEQSSGQLPEPMRKDVEEKQAAAKGKDKGRK